MSRKTFLIITSVLLTFLIVLVGYYLIVQNGEVGPDGKRTGFRSFFPFGGSGNGTTTPREVVSEEIPPENKNFGQKLRKISSEPVAGAGILDVKEGSIIRYIEKATGHIYEVELFSPRQDRISNTTIPLVYDAVWGNKNSSLLTRYLKDDDRTIDSYALTIKENSSSTESTVSAISFPINISDVSSRDNSIFYLEQKENSSTGFIANFNGTGKKQIWNSEIKELLSQYVNPKTVILTTKPAKNIPGYAYSIDTGNGQTKKVLGGIEGLSVLSNDDLSQILYIKQQNGLQMSVFDPKSKLSAPVSPATFPEKCVWSKKDKSILYCAVPQDFLSEDSLTNWYQGAISFIDDIWRYDTKNNTSSIILSLYNESGEVIDLTKIALSDNEQYLIFVNRIDDSLWSLDLLQTLNTEGGGASN